MILRLPSVASVSHTPEGSNVSELGVEPKIDIEHTSFFSADNAVQYAAKSGVVPLGFAVHQSRAQIFLKESAKEIHLHKKYIPCCECVGRPHPRWSLGVCSQGLGPDALSWHADVDVDVG